MGKPEKVQDEVLEKEE